MGYWKNVDIERQEELLSETYEGADPPQMTPEELMLPEEEEIEPSEPPPEEHIEPDFCWESEPDDGCYRLSKEDSEIVRMFFEELQWKNGNLLQISYKDRITIVRTLAEVLRDASKDNTQTEKYILWTKPYDMEIYRPMFDKPIDTRLHTRIKGVPDIAIKAHKK